MSYTDEKLTALLLELESGFNEKNGDRMAAFEDSKGARVAAAIA